MLFKQLNLKYLNTLGYAKLYLNAETKKEMFAKSEFHGIWKANRRVLMGTPQRYDVSITLYAYPYLDFIDGELVALPVEPVEISFRFLEPVTPEELWQVMAQEIKDVVDNSPNGIEVIKDKTYAILKVY